MPSSLQELIDRLQSKTGILVLTIAAGVVFFVAVAGGALSSRGDKSAFDSVTSTTSTTTSTSVASSVKRDLPGFEPVAFSVAGPNGVTQKYCAAHARSTAQQSTGMQNKESFGGYDAMLFSFETDSSAQFYMKDVKVPLFIAFFDGGGKFISQSEMPLCTVDECPRFGAAHPFRFALETPQGGLQIAPGSTVAYGGGCA